MRRFLGLGLVVLLLAGCGAAQSSAVPQEATTAQASQSGKSWMLLEARGDDLIYVSDGGAGVYAYSYPGFKLVGQLTVPYAKGTEGLCVDKHGDVFVPAWTGDGNSVTAYVYEFAHGGTDPIATLDDSGALDTSCSVDSTTGNLAVTNAYQSGYDDGSVVIYQDARGNPTTYVPNIRPEWSAYDDSGNLFVTGYNEYDVTKLVELPTGGSSFAGVSLNESVEMFSVQWNNGYLVASSGSEQSLQETLYRIQISGSGGTVVGSTALDIKRRVEYEGNGQFLILDTAVLGAGERHSCLQLWRYPSGGNAMRTLVKNISPWGVVFSASHSPVHRQVALPGFRDKGCLP
jgi:hypothetical protein